MRVRDRLILVALFFLSLAAAEHHGIVSFGGLPVPGATVTATQGTKRLITVTNPSGIYAFTNLSDGAWTIQVEMLCFAPMNREVTVAAKAPAAEWDLKLLPLGGMRAERHAAAPTPVAAAAVEPAEKKPGPAAANTSTAFQRAGLSATVAAGKLTADPELQTKDVQDKATEGLLINGSVNNGGDSSFSQAAAFGNFRKGAPLYNGSIVISENSFALDARPFSLTGQNTPRPDYNQLTASASIGGPLWIPRLWTLNKAPRFFLNYQRTRNHNATTATGRMPDDAERSGEPWKIPLSRISQQARHLVALYPQPNFHSAAGYNYQIPLLNANHQDALRSNLSKSIHNKNFLWGNFSIGSTRADNPSIFGFIDTSRVKNLNASGTWTHIVSTHLFSTLTLRLDRSFTRTVPFFANREDISGNAGIKGNNQDPINWGPPNLTFASGITALTDALPSFTRNQSAGFSYSLSWNRRLHSLKTGVDYHRQQVNLLSQQNPRGSFSFTGATTGSDFAGFLLGIPDTSAVAYGNADKYFRSNTYAAFVNDDWSVTSGLSLNIGVRWEYSSPVAEKYGRLVNLDIASGFTAAAPVVAATPNDYPASLIYPDRSLIQPRLAFAWRPVPASSLILRGGYGIYADTSVYSSIATQMAQQPPLSRNLSIENSLANPITLADGFKAPAGVEQPTFAVDPNFRMGYAQNWTFSVQHGLPGGMVASVGYLGIRGTHARQATYPNTFPAGAANPCPSCPTGFEYLGSGGNSTRNAAQFRLRRRLHRGLAASLQYTFAKAIDNATLGGDAQSALLVAQNWLNLDGDRALSSFDQRHLVNLQAQYSTGVGVGGGTLLGGWRGVVFKDWTMSSQLTTGSGLPLSPIYPMAVVGTGFAGSIRPDSTGAPLYDAPPGLHINPSAFAPPQPGHWGNAGRNIITGPAQFALDASLARTFRLTDRFNLEFRAEATNVLNHVTYRSWVTAITSTQFGLPDTANAMRTIRSNFLVRF